MKFVPVSPVFLALISLATASLAADSTPEAKTLMTTRGKVLLSDDLTGAERKDWRTPKGKWEVADGGLRGAEVPEEKHGAVTRHGVKYQDAVIQYDFKLDGTRGISLSINDKEHLARVVINAGGFTVQKDDRDHEGPDKAVIFQKVTMPIKAGEWHTIVVEILGKEMLATIDGVKTGFGEHDRIADAKNDVGLTVGGQTASFRNLRVWEAQPNADWAANKAKLAAAAEAK